MIAVCWHFAYGVWLFAAKWGITPGETARRRFGYICFVFGVLIAGMGLASIWAFVGPKYPNAPSNVPLSYRRTEMREQRSVAAVEPGKFAVTAGDPVGWPAGIC